MTLWIRALVLVALVGAPHCAANAQENRKAPQIAVNKVLAMPAPERAPEADSEQISAVVVTGNEAISDGRFQQAIESFFGEPLTEEVLERLNDELVELAREEGYPYARTVIDDTSTSMGIIEVKIDEGRIDSIAIAGVENAAARRTLQTLVGRPASKRDLESTLLLVSDIPAVILRGAKLRRIDGESVLVVELDERKSSARIGADNYGTDAFGPIRANISGRLLGAFASGDEFRTSVRVNPIEPDELLFASANYTTQLTANGMTFEVGLGRGRTAPGGVLDGENISGDTGRVNVGITAPIKRTKKASVWIDTEFNYAVIEQDDLGTMLRDDTVVTATVGLRTQFKFAGGWARTGVAIERGLGLLGATRMGDPLASRSDGDGVFTKVRFNADMRLPLAKRLDIYLAGVVQLADRPLLASEELGLGGPYTVRGYDFAEVLGDEGLYGLAELRYRIDPRDLPFELLQFYAFADGGYVSDIDNDFGEGSLFSAGTGLRARLGALDLEVEGAFPLGGSGERRTSDDPEINVRAGLNF